MGSLVGVLNPTQSELVEGAGLGGPTHIGTFEGSTTFTTSSGNGVNPGLFIEVMDDYGNLMQYESEEGVVTVPNTKEGAYITQAKLLGKTKYRDIDTNEILDTWEPNRNLELTSVEKPELKMVGKNLFDGNWYVGYSDFGGGGVLSQPTDLKAAHRSDYIEIKPNTSYIFKTYNYSLDSRIFYNLFDANLNKLTEKSQSAYSGVSVVDFSNIDTNAKYIVFHLWNENGFSIKDVQVQLEEGTTATKYEPYQSNSLTVNEEVELRGVGDVRDELDLLTGELTQRVGEVVLDGGEEWILDLTTVDSVNTHIFYTSENFAGFKPFPNYEDRELYILSDKFKVRGDAYYRDEECLMVNQDARVYVRVLKSKLLTQNIEGFKTWLQSNNLKISTLLDKPTTKTVVLDSDYYFQPVMNRDIYVDGNIVPLICSVTIPTESLSFVLNPNEEREKQFVAPEFTITNNNPTSIYLELKTFEQLTDVLNDVLPETHNDWSQLDREQSKDIALALVPKVSDGWLALDEGPRYVADNSNYYLGEVKAESSVDFTFEAKHGRAFLEAMNPKYRLSFVFDFFDN